MPGAPVDLPGLEGEATRLIEAGQIEPLIIVRLDVVFPSETYLFDQVIPFVEQHFRVLPVRQHRAISGWSASGTQPFSLAKKRPGVFGLVGSFALIGEFGDGAFQSYDAAQYPLRWAHRSN